MIIMSSPNPMRPFLEGHSGRNTRSLLRIVILCTIAAAAVASRLFSVIREYRYGSQMHAP